MAWVRKTLTGVGDSVVFETGVWAERYDGECSGEPAGDPFDEYVGPVHKVRIGHLKRTRSSAKRTAVRWATQVDKEAEKAKKLLRFLVSERQGERGDELATAPQHCQRMRAKRAQLEQHVPFQRKVSHQDAWEKGS